MAAVLLVEDNSAIRELVCLVLEEVELPVVEAASGAEALGLLSRHSPKLVITDWRLPDQGGMEFVRQLRQSCRPGVPILVLSAAGEAQQATTIEATEFLAKPFDTAELLACVQKLLVRQVQ
jgi:DNA-binding response OmpR family regulator